MALNCDERCRCQPKGVSPRTPQRGLRKCGWLRLWIVLGLWMSGFQLLGTLRNKLLCTLGRLRQQLRHGLRACEIRLRRTVRADFLLRVPATLVIGVTDGVADERVQEGFLCRLARQLRGRYIQVMCGRVIQSSRPLRYAIVDGMNVRDSRFHNYPPRWNGAPSQELLVIRRNHKTGEISLDPLRWGLIPYWCKDPAGGRKPINAKCETVRDLPT